MVKNKKTVMEPQVNGFKQVELFYEWLEDNPSKDVSPVHISLYFALLMHNSELGWKKWFLFPPYLAREMALVSSRSSYVKILDDLIEWGLIATLNSVTEGPYIISIKQTT